MFLFLGELNSITSGEAGRSRRGVFSSFGLLVQKVITAKKTYKHVYFGPLISNLAVGRLCE